MAGRDREAARYAAFAGDGAAFATPQRVPAHGSVDPDDPLGPARYPDDDGFTMVELPYKGGRLAMLVIAPRRHDGLAAVEAHLSAATLAEWTARLEARAVHVWLPRFRLETKYRMNEPLQALGMARAFRDPREPDGARFDDLTTSTDPRDRLFVSVVAHKAFVEVTEEGTEAAAATAVAMALPTAAPATVPFTPEFRADRPFLVLIRDVETGAVMFMGRVMRPGA
ncbi:hypothetical protein GF314_00010 [bacterium]|nr:hypothetical protein [bacterium]